MPLCNLLNISYIGSEALAEPRRSKLRPFRMGEANRQSAGPRLLPSRGGPKPGPFRMGEANRPSAGPRLLPSRGGPKPGPFRMGEANRPSAGPRQKRQDAAATLVVYSGR
jgi:hypothetical protein